MSFNPYQPPTSAYDGNYTQPAAGGMVVSDKVVAGLRKTRPWALLIAVFSFIYAGFLALGALGLMFEKPAEGFVALFFAAIAALPGAFLARYAGAIHKLLHGGGVAELEKAIESQASFWQIAGIMTLVVLALMMFVIVAAIAGLASFLDAF